MTSSFGKARAPHSKTQLDREDEAIFEEMGYGQDEVMRMSFETHSESFWRSENFFSMVIENLAEIKGCNDTICYSFSGELPARISHWEGLSLIRRQKYYPGWTLISRSNGKGTF